MHRPPGFVVGRLLATIVITSVVAAGATVAGVRIGRTMIGSGASVALPTVSLRALQLRSVVYDDAGHAIATLSGPQDRAFAPLRSVAPVLQHAVLAAEDRYFYEHGAVDLRAIGRAFAKNVDTGSVEQGGSTLTQQLVKNTQFTDPKRDLQRKVKEAVLATALEKRYTKQQIFEQYLNTVYFGHGAYGVRAAAELYFGRTERSVDLAQSAMLAALIANPGERDPLAHPGEAARRRDIVLVEMQKARWASPRDVAVARREPLPTAVHRPKVLEPANPFVDEVKRELLADPRMGATYAERYRRLFEGGVRIYTTFDARLQALASWTSAATLPPSRYTDAMVVIDNTDGAIRALVPGGSYRAGGFDLALQGARQTGSAFKAITLAAALAAGFSPNDLVNANGHCTLRFDPRMPPWNLQNYEGESLGTVTLTEALAKSSNCAFARLAVALGPQHIVDMAHRLGIARPLQPVPSITLGTEEVSPLDMASAYSVIAADGVRHPPRIVERVETADGHVILRNPDSPTRVLDPQIARTETEMLTHVVREGTATATLGNFPRAAAGKTGTNDQSRDVWFVGYTPQLTVAVWIGDPNGLVPVVLNGSAQVGGGYPAKIWGAFMNAALTGAPDLQFPAPNAALWPPARYISDAGAIQAAPPATRTGRRFVPRPAPPVAPPTAPPGTRVPATTGPATAPVRHPATRKHQRGHG